jgi:hypothetical protein
MLGRANRIFQVRCKPNTTANQARHRTLVDLRFSSSLGFEKVVSNESQQGKWETIEPNSLTQRLWRFACSKH